MHSIQYNCVINGNQFLIYDTQAKPQLSKINKVLKCNPNSKLHPRFRGWKGLILRHPIPLRYNAAKAPMNRVMLQITFTLITRPNHPIQNKRAVDKVIMISMKEANSFTKYRRQK